MREDIALFLLFLVIVLIVFLFYNVSDKDGFRDIHKDYVLRQQKQFNSVGLPLYIKKNNGLLGDSANSFLNTFSFKKNTPLIEKRDGVWESSDICEKVKVMDCSAFDNPDFKKVCGMCLDIGKNSENVPTAGGLVLLESDRKLARESAVSNYLPNYVPSVGFCPAGKMVSTKEECLKLQRELLCRKNSSYDLPGCSQCYSDTSYSIVDPVQSPGVITGSGEILVMGEGILKVEEQGMNGRSGIRLSKTSPRKIKINGKEGVRIKFTIEPVPVSSDDDPVTPYIAGVLNGTSASGTFSSDLRRIVLVDEKTGRKPRSSGKDTVNEMTVTRMSPGFGQETAVIVVIVPFTFVETTMEESSKCKDGPFVTTQAAAEFLESDPCYKKGSGPGKYSLECLQGLWDSNGCSESGKAYPKDVTSAAALMTGPDGSFSKLNDIADFIYNKALISSTGIDENGEKQTMKNWSDASVYCTGREITSPCDTPAKTSGPLSPECIIHLWNNQSSKKTWQGHDDPIGPTYHNSNAVSLFAEGPTLRSCQAAGTLSPVDITGKKKRSIIAYWQKQGGVNNVKRVMADLHRAANAQMAADDQLAPYFKQCYGDIPFAPRPPTVFKIANNMLPSSYSIATNNRLVNSLTMTQDYKLQFVIKPKGIQGGWSNIIHFTATDSDWCAGGTGCRSPSIWFWPGGLRLHVRIGAFNDWNWGIDIGDCQINKESSFSLECRGTSVKLTLDGQVITGIHPNWRYSGNLKVYGSSPWYVPALADIKDVGLQLFGNSIKVNNGPWVIDSGPSGVNVKAIPLPLGISPNAHKYRVLPHGYGDKFVFRREGNNLMMTRVDFFGGWGASFQVEISDGVMPNIGNVRYVRIEGGTIVLNLSQLVVLDQYGNNISRGRPQQVLSETYGDANKTKPNDGGEAPRGHPNEYHGKDGGSDLWQVQLDGPRNVSSVIVYNRSDCCADRMGSGYVIKLYNDSGVLLFTSNKLTSAPVQVVQTVENNTGWITVHGNNGTVTCDQYCRGPRSIWPNAEAGPWNGELPREWNGAKCVGSSNPDVGCNRGPPGGVVSGFKCKCEKTGKGW